MNTRLVYQQEIEKLLTELNYEDLELLNYDSKTNSYFYNGYLDTDYRIHVIMKSLRKVEVWDCVYDEENYARAGVGYFVDEKWLVVDG